MKPKPLIRPTEGKGLSPRRPNGIADTYRIYQHAGDAPKISFLTLVTMLLSLIITILSGASVASIFIKKGQAQLAPFFETLYEEQLLYKRLPKTLIRAYLPQIAENKLPVNVYHVLDRGITRRATGTLIQNADGRYRLRNNRILSDCFDITAVRHIFTAPKWVGERVCIVIEV